MANPIPPLLCCTPPPMDFDEETSANDDFCEFETGDTETFDGQSLPSTPRHLIHTINKKLESNLTVKDKNNTIEPTKNKENIYCDYKTASTVGEIDSAIVSVELGGKVIEEHQNEEESISEYISDFEESSKIEKSLQIFSDNLSESENCDPDSNVKHTSNSIDTREELYNSVHNELTNKKILESDDKNIKSFEEKVEKEKNLNIHDLEFSHIKIDELSASKNEMLTSNINEINSDILKSKSIDKEDEFENVSSTINSTIKNNENEIIANKDEICDINLESKCSEAINADKEECNFTFEADFSQFQTFESFETQTNEISKYNNSAVIDNVDLAEIKKEQTKESFDDEDEFENFQIYETVNVPDEGDSNQFTDFKEAAPPPLTETSTTSNSLATNCNLKQKIKSILDTMFPENENDTDSYSDINVDNDLKKKSILNSVDSATALNFQWANSTIKHSLVKSIGIDSRNILHGEKWNSSMPRFAANLGFNPLEPLKPVKIDTISNTSNFLESEPSTSLGKVVATRIDVPAVEFDWNTSGLVNPLDGAKEVMHERKTEKLHTTKSGELPLTTETVTNDFNCSGPSSSNDTKSVVKIHEDKEPVITKEYLSTFDTNLTIEPTGATIIKTNNLENVKNLEQLSYTNFQSSENIDVISTSTSSNANPFIVPLKETHIFTPSKSDAAISRSTTNISESTVKCAPIDFDYEIAAAGTVIDETVIKKEYRDIEYNPSKFILNTLNTNSIQLNDNQNSLNAEKSEISEGPLKNELSIVNGGWDFYNNTLNTDTNDIYALDSTLINDTNLTKELSIDTNEGLNKFQDASSMENFNIPTIGLSPTENLTIKNEFHKENKEIEDPKIYVDDEFTDFQFVPPTTIVTTSFPTITNSTDIKSTESIPSHSIKLKDNEKNNRINTSDQMILSPAILLPQTVQLNCEPKIDWPEPGIDPEELARIETLFPSSKQSNFHNQVSSSFNHTSNISNASTVHSDDDWSDFISVPAVNIAEHNLNTIYCPKSPTKVSKSSTTPTEFNNDDEWSDFISSTSSTNTMSLGQFQKTDNGPLNKNSLRNNSYSPVIAGTNTSQQNFKNNVPNQVNTNNDQTMINNKICQYLLNNGNVETKGRMHLNSLKTTDFIPQYSYQQQQQMNKHFSNHPNIAPNISLIPDLGYVAPQKFISIPKKKFQKK